MHELALSQSIVDLVLERARVERVRTVRVEADLLAKNDRIAAANREWFVRWELLALNLVSSPGAGKTMLLERTLRDVAGAWPCVVIEGDQRTIMKNQNGVVTKLTSTTQGASLKLAASGVRFTLEK